LSGAPSALWRHDLKHINNMRLMPYFSTSLSIDQTFDHFAIPRPVLKRILGGFHRIPFRSEIIDRAESLSERCIEPCLMVAVESNWLKVKNTTTSEVNGTSLLDVDVLVFMYVNCILDVLKRHKVGGILLMFDNPSLLTHFNTQLRSLESLLGYALPYYYHNFGNDVDPLVAAAVDLLVLATGSILLGKRKSRLFDVAYWLGANLRRQHVYFVPDELPLTTTTDWVSTIIDPAINRISQCLSLCYLRYRNKPQSD
jgi:hypothetical protein